DHSEKIGFRNVRPLKWYRYLYPFPDSDLRDIAYYFDFDYAQPIDDGGHLAALHEIIAGWKTTPAKLYAVPRGEDIVIHDTRPVAAAPQTVLNGVERRILEICDQITTVNRIQQVLSSSTGMTFSADYVRVVLDEFIEKNLVVCEDERFLALPVLT